MKLGCEFTSGFHALGIAWLAYLCWLALVCSKASIPAAEFFLHASCSHAYGRLFICAPPCTGMVMVCVTPNVEMGVTIGSMSIGFWFILSGFLIPRPAMPAWWAWAYYLVPVSWEVYAIVAAQLGDKARGLLACAQPSCMHAVCNCASLHFCLRACVVSMRLLAGQRDQTQQTQAPGMSSRDSPGACAGADDRVA